MQRESLYVVNDLGRERFIWATSAAEARALAAPARTTEPRSPSGGHTIVPGTAPLRLTERQMRFKAAAES